MSLRKTQQRNNPITDVTYLELLNFTAAVRGPATQEVVLCIGSNLGLKFGQERPIRVLLPHLAERTIYK